MSGEFPPDWSTPELGDFAKATGGSGFPPSAQGSTEGDYPFYKVSDMNLPGNERFMGDANHWITEETRKRIKARTFPVGTVIFPKIGAAVATNKKRLLTRESIIDNNVMAVVVDDPKRCAFSYLRFWFETIDLRDLSNSGALPSIPGHRVHTMRVPLPPLPEQKKIAHILSTVQRAIEAQERIIQTTTELKKALMHKLFTEGLRHEPQKQTEIGPVPESWEVEPLVSLLREPLRNGHSAKATTDEGGIRTLTLTAVTQRDFSMDNTKVTCADPHRVRDMWLRSGDIFIERANTADYVGLAALYEGPEDFAIFPDLLIRVRVDNNRIRPKVLIEWLLAEPCRRYYKKNARSTAGNFPKIDQGTVEKTLIPVPSAEEQAELENSFRTVDEKLRQHIARKAALQDLFRTLLHELMTAKTRVHELELGEEVIA